MTNAPTLSIPIANECQLVRTPFHFVVAVAVCLAMSWLPILFVAIPPIGDYPNTLARMHVIQAWARSQALQSNYVVHWVASPYLAMDLIVPTLAQFISIYHAGQLFLLFTVSLQAAGALGLHFALFRKMSLWALAIFPFIFNYDLAFGFANYLFGMGMWLAVFAFWVGSSEWPAVRRLPLFGVLACCVYFSHYFAFLAYGLTIGAYEFGQWWDRQRWSFPALLGRCTSAGSQFLVPLALLAWDMHIQRGSGVTSYGMLDDKVVMLTSPTRFPGSHFDLALLGFALLVLIAGLSGKWIRLNRAMRVPVAALGIACVTMPSVFSGVWGIDFRLPPALAMIVIASSRLEVEQTFAGRAILFIFAVLFVGHITTIYEAWRETGASYHEFRISLSAIDKGAKVLPFSDSPGFSPMIARWPTFYRHIACLAVIDRDAFVPTLFKDPWLPVQSSASNKAIDTTSGQDISSKEIWDGTTAVGSKLLGNPNILGQKNYWADWPRHYDYVIGINVSPRTQLPEQLRPVYIGSFFVIYKVESKAK